MRCAAAWAVFSLYLERQETMKNLLVRLWREDDGQDLVEYGLLLVLVALAAIAGMKGLATAINTTFSSAAANLTTAGGG
jgi:pilus assembly protein Flp/PilA